MAHQHAAAHGLKIPDIECREKIMKAPVKRAFFVSILQQNVDLKLFHRKRPESHNVNATEVTQSGPTINSLQHYKNANLPPQIDEAPYLTTCVAVRPRNSTYAKESLQAAAAESMYANETPLNCDPSSAYENNTNDIVTPSDKHIYEDV